LRFLATPVRREKPRRLSAGKVEGRRWIFPFSLHTSYFLFDTNRRNHYTVVRNSRSGEQITIRYTVPNGLKNYPNGFLNIIEG
jgi:hypothetical protein